MREIVMVLRDLKGVEDPLEVKWEVEDNPLGLEWFYALKQNFIGPDAMCPLHPLEKSHCLNGWIDTVGGTNNPGLRDIPTMCDELNWAIRTVNDFYKDKGYPHIDLHFTPEALQSDQYRDLMNQLHHHFELLIGQVWDVSDWFKMANRETIYAIRVLNNNCHQIENIINSVDLQKISSDRKTLHQSIMLSFNGINWLHPDKEKKQYMRYNVTDDAYDYWSPNYEWGHLYAYYCQLGKRHVEAFYDEDPHIDHKNISGIRYFTGEATMNLCTMFAPGSGMPKEQRPEFIKWLVDNGFDPEDKKNAYGHGVVARIELPMDYKQYHDEIIKRNDVYKLGWRENGVESIREFDYTWKEQVLGEIQISKDIDNDELEAKRARQRN
tara:strand:- start:712 stop:1851 length:1140 start_codon:yes stop_codon:yes gene_type:complete